MLSAFSKVPISTRANLARKSKHAKARGEVSEVGEFILMNSVDRRKDGRRKTKYEEMTSKLTEFIV